MRTLICALILGAVFSCGLASAQSPSPPFSISISAEKNIVRAGSDVFIQIQMTNTSNHSIDCTRVASNGLDKAYEYELRDKSGAVINAIPRKHPEIGEPFSAWPCVLKPGESTTKDDALISKLFDLSKPGRYVVQVSRLIAGEHKEQGVTKSNSITITVTP
jgi:hypothetical protein